MAPAALPGFTADRALDRGAAQPAVRLREPRRSAGVPRDAVVPAGGRGLYCLRVCHNGLLVRCPPTSERGVLGCDCRHVCPEDPPAFKLRLR